MKLAIISSRYPSEDNHYAHTFVHARSRYFSQTGHQVTVFVPAKQPGEYVYQGITVKLLDARAIARELGQYDLAYFHLLNIYPQPWKSGAPIYHEVIKHEIPSAYYIHGSEVQTYFSREFDSHWSLREFAKYLYKDWYFIPIMRRIVKRLMTQNCAFITPSKWMESEAQQQLGLPALRAEIIPNGIDTELFSPSPESASESNTKLLCIRPLSSNKYAVDIAIRVMSHLPESFSLDIFGRGPKKAEFVALAKKLGVADRINFKSDFIAHDEMPDVMRRYSYFLSPTRMDAQGVTMCEAIACGRIVASSANTAIPEFIEHGQNGILGDSPRDIAQAITHIEADAALKKRIAKQAVQSMRSLDTSVVLEKERQLLLSLVANK